MKYILSAFETIVIHPQHLVHPCPSQTIHYVGVSGNLYIDGGIHLASMCVWRHTTHFTASTDPEMIQYHWSRLPLRTNSLRQERLFFRKIYWRQESQETFIVFQWWLATLWWGCQCSRQTGSVVGGESVNIPPYTSFVFKRFLQDLGPDVWRMYRHKMMLSNFMGRVCIWQTHKIMCTCLHLGNCRFSKEFAIQCQGRIQ